MLYRRFTVGHCVKSPIEYKFFILINAGEEPAYLFLYLLIFQLKSRSVIKIDLRLIINHWEESLTYHLRKYSKNFGLCSNIAQRERELIF